MRDGRPSTTASFVACARGAGGIDPIAERLVPKSVATLARPHRRRWTRLFPIVDFMKTRTLAIDAAIAAATRTGSRQLVVLGAGLCARAWRMAELAETTVYEVDHPATQTYKRERLGELAPKAKEVRFVSVDFEKDDLSRSLDAAGQDASEPTTWVWEGVTPYLTPAAIAGTLDAVRGRSATGSALVLTYYTPFSSGDVGRRFEAGLLRLSDRVFSVIGEPIRGLMTVDEMHALLRSKGFVVVSDATNRELARGRSGRRSPLDVTERVMTERILVATRRSDD